MKVDAEVAGWYGTHVQSGVTSDEDLSRAWHQKFSGTQMGLFLDYEYNQSSGKRTGFCYIRIGDQTVVARLGWQNDGKSLLAVMPIPRRSLMAVSFSHGATRAHAEAFVVGFIARDFLDRAGNNIADIDQIFQTAKPGEVIARNRWNSGGAVKGDKTDRASSIYLKADGSVVVTPDDAASSPLTITFDVNGGVTITNAKNVNVTSDHATINSNDINLGGTGGSPIVRNLDFPVHVDPSTGATIPAFQFGYPAPQSSTTTKAK